MRNLSIFNHKDTGKQLPVFSVMKQNKIMVLDTETASLKGGVYDIGYTIATARGDILIERNWLVKETFTNGTLMKGAFFASKMFSHYAQMLQDGVIELTNWRYIIAFMRYDFYAYDVNILAAYNLPFDMRVMTQTNKMLGGNTPLLPPCKKLDIYRFACMTLLNTPTYKKLCTQRGWISKAGNFRTNAENAYRYCIGNFTFAEDHTALSDAIIETEILRRCYAAKKTIPYNDVREGQWKIVNPKTTINTYGG